MNAAPTGSLSVRQRESEWMDAPDADPGQLSRSLAYIRRVNRWIGYTRSTLTHLKRFSRNWAHDERIRILDVATGSADVPLAILRWADSLNRRRQSRWDVRIVAMDLHHRTLECAREQAGGERRIKLLRADALRLPFEAGSFDYALTSMFLHHLSDSDAAAALLEMARVARRGVIVADLHRDRAASRWIWLFTLLSSPMVRHDARVSVRQAFNQAEIRALCDRAGLGWLRYHPHFGHRFVLAGEMQNSHLLAD